MFNRIVQDIMQLRDSLEMHEGIAKSKTTALLDKALNIVLAAKEKELSEINIDRRAVNIDSFELIGSDLINKMHFSESLCNELGLPYSANEYEQTNGSWSFCAGDIFRHACGYDLPHRKLIAYYIIKDKRINLRPATVTAWSGESYHNPGWFKLVEHHSKSKERPSITSLCE